MNLANTLSGPRVPSFKWTLALGVQSLMPTYAAGWATNVTWGQRLAVCTFFSPGPVVVFLLAQNRLIGGIARTGIKG